MQLAYTGFYLVKRLGYMGIMIFLKNKITLQIQALYLMNIVIMIYQGKYQPFEEIA
jgi:hypothetical protein